MEYQHWRQLLIPWNVRPSPSCPRTCAKNMHISEERGVKIPGPQYPLPCWPTSQSATIYIYIVFHQPGKHYNSCNMVQSTRRHNFINPIIWTCGRNASTHPRTWSQNDPCHCRRWHPYQPNMAGMLWTHRALQKHQSELSVPVPHWNFHLSRKHVQANFWIGPAKIKTGNSDSIATYSH